MTSHQYPLDRSRRWRNVLVITLVGGLFLTFWLPTLIPPATSASESFLFGFNNRLCLLLFLAIVAAVAVIAKVSGLKLPVSSRDSGEGVGSLNGRVIALCLGIGAGLCALLLWLTYPLGGINDSAYFLDRVHLLAKGRAPFRDFEFVYGSGPLYGSLLLGRLLHTSPKFGYFTLWTISSLLGIFLFWVAIRWMDTPARGKRTVFLLICAVMLLLIPAATLNYSALRYTLPVFAIAGFCRIDRASSSANRLSVICFAAAMSGLLLNFSPEEGLAYTVSMCIYLPVRRYYARRPFVPDLLILLGLAAALFAMAAHAGTFTTMKRFGAGAFNLPIYPGPHILMGFAAVLGLVFYVMSGPAVTRSQSNVAFATLYSIGMLPGALGRADMIHILGYLLPAFVSAMLLAWLWLPAWRFTTIAFSLVFLIIPPIIGFSSPPVLSKAFLNHLYGRGVAKGSAAEKVDHLATRLAVAFLGPERGLAKMTALRNAAAATSVDPHKIFPGASSAISIPFNYSPNKVSNYYADSLDEGYFMGVLNILTPQEVERKVDELRLHPEEDLLVSYDGLNTCGVRVGSRVEIRELLFLPWVPKARNESPLLVPLCDYIHQNYDFVYLPSPATFSYGLMRRRASAPAR